MMHERGFSYKCLVFLFGIVRIIQASAPGSSSVPFCHNGEECLLKHLFGNGYDNRARPISSQTGDIAVRLTIRLDLYRLIDVDVKQGKITLHCFIYETWFDRRLAWNPFHFDNITSISIDRNNIWIPDTTLINAATSSDSIAGRGLARIETQFDPIQNQWSSARMVLAYSTILEPFCLMDTTFFPFDRQICYLTLGSAGYDASKLQFLSATKRLTLERYENVGEWTVEDLRMEEDYVFYDCCPLPFSQLKARIVITRKPLFYIVNLILPTLITNLLATVGLFSNLKVCGGEITAATLGLTTLLSFSILLLSISEQMARGSQWISLMGCFFAGTLVQTSTATVTSVYLMQTDRRNRLRRIFRNLSNSNSNSKSNSQLNQKLASVTSSMECDFYGSKIRFTDTEKENRSEKYMENDKRVENWCMCLHIIFTLTFTVILLTIGTVNAYVVSDFE